MATEKPARKASAAAAAPAAGKKRRRSSPKPTAAASKKAAATKARKTKQGTSAKTDPAGASGAASSLPATPPPSRMLLVDNGGDSLKYGWMDHAHDPTEDGTSTPFPHSLPNASARLMHQFTTLVGDELHQVQNPNSLMPRTRSTERGVICNLENQTRVWKRMLDLLGVAVPLHTVTARCMGWNATAAAKKKKAGKLAGAGAAVRPPTVPPHALGVLLLLPPHCPRILLDQIATVWMEDFGVSHVGFGISSACASHDQSLRTPWKTSCTVDLGWSSTLVVPTFRSRLVQGAAAGGGATPPVNANAGSTTTIRRIPVGGRHMINMLKYYMSYRQYNLMDQEVLMRDVFERLSFFSMDMGADLKLARRKPPGQRIYDRDFLLPDYTNTTKGEIRIPFALQKILEREKQQKAKGGGEQQEEDEDEDEEDDDFEAGSDEDDENDDDEEDFREGPEKGKSARKKQTKKKGSGAEDNDGGDEEEEEEESMEEKRKRLLRERAEEERRKREREEEEQVLRVSVERFVVPEVLFRPMDAGLQPDLVGLSQAIVQSVEACPEAYRPALYRTVYLVGGVARLPNLRDRLERELRSLVPSEYELSVSVADSPIDRAWMGAKAYFEKEPYTKYTVSRQEWEQSSKRKAYTKLLIENGGCYA